MGRHGAWFTRDPAEASEYAERNDSQGYKYDGWNAIKTNTASRVIPAYIKAENPYTGDLPDDVLRDNYKKAQSDWFDTLRRKGHDSWIPARHNGNLVVVLKEPQQIKSIYNNGKFDPNQKHMNRATGGRTVNKMNMYSKAAEVARSLPQAKGSVDQMLAMLRKGGVKPAELEHAGRPAGDMIDRETLAKHFEDALPKVSARQYGEQPFSMTQDENQEYNHLMNRHHASQYRTGAARAEPLSPEEMKRFEDLGSRMRRKDPVSVVGEDEDGGPAETGYHDYQTPGGKDYRERLLTLPKRKGTPSWTVSGPSIINPREHDTKEAADADAAQMNSRLSPDIHPSRRHRVSETTRESTDNYQSSHWRGDDNVLAHIRMKDVPVDGRRALHIEEIQSDWAQEGRKQGFYDPKNPYEIFKTTTGETVSKHPSQDAMWDAYRAIPEDQAAGIDYGHASHTSAKKPNAPYVKNTAHWTDLALKNILAEAAHGRYDHVTFTGGQEQADRYGLEKSLRAIHYTPETKTLHAERIGQHRPIIQQDVAPEQVASYIGSEAANKLLDPSNAYEVGGVRRHSLVDDDLKMGGEGMKGYYDNILPKAAMKLVQQHDPSIQPSTINGNFGFTMTPKARESILQGQPAFAKGGEVDNNNQGDDQYGKTAPLNPAPRPQAGEFPVSGGVRGGSGVLQAPYETSLEGLPQKVSIPLTGGSVSAGHDPRIRQIARDYMASTGMPYNPPTKYAKVDPKRASRIAAAYDDMKDDASDPLTKASYDAMIKETMAQYHAAKNAGFKAEFWNPEKDEDPYKASPRLATEDVRNNHHMWVYPTRSGYGSDGPITAKELAENPLLQDSGETWNGQPVTVNDIFRAVHDYYGHAKEGVGFRGDGEENAWRSHASMYSPLARMAMTSETRGQNSWLNYGVHGDKNRNARTEDTIFAPQKIGVLPHWAHHEGAEDFMRPEDVKAMAEIHKRYGRAPGGAVDDDNPAPVIQNPMSIFPKPQRMFPEDQRPKGGQYISAHNKADVTGHKAEAATIGIGPNGKPFFQASQNAVDQTGTVGKGSATTKTNLFKQKAGWKWQDAPEGHENTETIVSVEHRGKHFYALNAHFPKGVDLARYENATSEPRLRPTTQGNVTLGPQAGSISVRGKMHPVYHHVIVKADGGAVGAALDLTRGFTKNGAGVMMSLKSKGK